jgi:hypothetical protein
MSVDHERRDDQREHPVPFGRRRFLATLGAGMFGIASRLVLPSGASAAPTPLYCGGALGCDTCDAYGVCTGCPAGSFNCRNVKGQQCWTACGPAGSGGCVPCYSCCDWLKTDYKTVCICRRYIGLFCPNRQTQTA